MAKIQRIDKGGKEIFETRPDKLVKIPAETAWQKHFWNGIGIVFLGIILYGVHLVIKGWSLPAQIIVAVLIVWFAFTVYSLVISGDL